MINFKILGGLVGGLLLLLGLTACQDATATPAGTTATTGGTSAAPAGITATPGQSTLKTTQAVITTTTGQTINMKLELAKTEQEQETGLMGRTSLPEDAGMLFIFPQKSRTSFWMKDTLMPLSIAWIDENGKILEIQDMEAQSETLHTPAQPYLWALEVPKGYFAKKGIQPGSAVKLLNA